jgi:hypothetical protein
MIQMATSQSSCERPMAPEPWLTKRELAQLLGCSTRTIERLDLPAMRVGGQTAIS